MGLVRYIPFTLSSVINARFVFYLHQLNTNVLSEQEMISVYKLYNGPIFYLLIVLTLISFFIRSWTLKISSICIGAIGVFLIFFNVTKFFVQLY